MQGPKQLLLVAIAVLLAIGASNIGVAASSKVVLAQLVHRHGARTPTSIHGDHKWACGSLGCGILTSEGKDMLYKLGLFARERYMLTPDTNASGTAYISNYSFYYPKRIVQRSTDVSRTLQSAGAFLQGFFDRDPSSFYPCINTVPLDTDSMLYVASIPAFELSQDVNKAKEDAAFAQAYLLPAINVSDWEALGEGFRLTGCGGKSSEGHRRKDDKNDTLVDCFKEVYDVAESYYSMGILDQFPLAYAYYDTLRQLTFEYHSQLLVWNPDTHVDGKRGPLGRNVVDALVQRMQGYMNQSDKDGEFFEYSVEDSMLCALTDTLGQPGFQLPQFGDAWFFELLLDQSDASYALRIFHGAPTQEPGDHQYTFSPFNITCQTSGGSVYFRADGTCPLPDFLNWYATQVGTSSEGYCYLRPEDRTALHCDKVESKAPHPKCAWYRRMCPEYACPSGSYLSYPLLNCVSL